MAKAPEALDPSIWHPELLAGPLRSKRLTVLYGAPGPLRDGMIRRGLMPLLRGPTPRARAQASDHHVPIRFDGWGPLPLQALRTRIDAEFQAAWPQGAPETLAAHLRAIGRQQHATVLLVLDAFERHLGERAERHDIERFDIELSECISDAAVPLHVLMVVDELENRALQRYTRWIANFGDEFVRLPNLLSGEHDATAWRDTDIAAPPEGYDDAAPRDSETDTDWPVDLLLDAPPPAQAPPTGVSTDAPTQSPPQPPPPMAPPAAPALEPPPTVAPVSFSAFETPPVGETRRDSAAPRTARATPARRIEPSFGTEAPDSSAQAPEPSAAPPPRAAGAPQAPFGAWPPLPAPAPAPTPVAAPRSVPPWLSEAEVEQMRRMHEPASRWPGLLGLALYMVALLAGAWWVANWIIDSQRVETRPRAPDNAPVAQAPPPAPAPNAPPATPQAAAPAPSPAPATPPPATSARTLTLAMPADADSAPPLVDEMIRRVAAPAGLDLRTAAGNQAASLTLLRTDALLEARAANAAPLQVVAPLYSEQIQVLVRTDARWDYVREIRGLRLNIGRPDGARARTARALYQQLFGTPLPAAQANALDLDAALQALQQRGGPIDAVIAISDAPITAHMQPAARKQVRELTISARDTSAVAALPGFSISRRNAADRARLATTTYLVAPGTPPRPHDAALRSLAAALCRAQPALQAQNSALLRGWRQGQQPDVGWPYVLPRTPNAACPAP